MWESVIAGVVIVNVVVLDVMAWMAVREIMKIGRTYRKMTK